MTNPNLPHNTTKHCLASRALEWLINTLVQRARPQRIQPKTIHSFAIQDAKCFNYYWSHWPPSSAKNGRRDKTIEHKTPFVVLPSELINSVASTATTNHCKHAFKRKLLSVPHSFTELNWAKSKYDLHSCYCSTVTNWQTNKLLLCGKEIFLFRFQKANKHWSTRVFPWWSHEGKTKMKKKNHF